MASLIQTQMEANAALRKHGLDVAGWTFKFDGAKKRGGLCDYSKKQISLSKHLVPMWSDAEVTETILHEVAHALAGASAGHGPTWRRMARMIGSNASRTHSNATVQGDWIAVCPVHGHGRKRYTRRRSLMCGRCYQRGIVNPLTYVKADSLLAQLSR